MTFNVKLTDEDYIAYNIHHALNSATGRQNMRKSRILLAFMTVIYAILFIISLFVFRDRLIFCVLLLMFMLYGIFRLATYRNHVQKSVRKAIANMKKQGKLPYAAETRYNLGEKEIVATIPDGVYHINYNDIEAVQKDSDHIYIMLNTINAEIIPIRDLNGLDGKLMDFLHGKCPCLQK